MATKKIPKETKGGDPISGEVTKDPEAVEPVVEKDGAEWAELYVETVDTGGDVNYSNTNITTYAHHGAMVQVRRDLKGQHRKYSLCHQCEHFKPDTLNNCHISQAIFDNCVKFHVTTPVWECPSFRLVK